MPPRLSKVIERKVGAHLFTQTGGVVGEKSLWAEVAEHRDPGEHAARSIPACWVGGHVGQCQFGNHRMGPVFGGMLLSGEKVADLIIKDMK